MTHLRLDGFGAGRGIWVCEHERVGCVLECWRRVCGERGDGEEGGSGDVGGGNGVPEGDVGVGGGVREMDAEGGDEG